MYHHTEQLTGIRIGYMIIILSPAGSLKDAVLYANTLRVRNPSGRGAHSVEQ